MATHFTPSTSYCRRRCPTDTPFVSSTCLVPPKHCTVFRSLDEAADSVLPLCTVLQRDAGSEVQLLELVPESGFDEDLLAALGRFIRPWGCLGPPGGLLTLLLCARLPRLLLHSWNVASLDADGVPLPTLDAQADALSQYRGRQFVEIRGIALEVARAKLQHCTMFPQDALHMLDFEAFDALFNHLSLSSPGPDGLPYACWSAARRLARARQTLFDVY